MILEFIKSISSKAPSWAREQGLLKESIAIEARYNRQKKYWDPHLTQCHFAIEHFLNEYPSAKRIGVLGSGHLFDFPTSVLNDPSFEIFLFDAVHPRSRKIKSAKAKLNFVSCDLNFAFEILSFDYNEFSSCELMLSTNLLSQLALMGSARAHEQRSEVAQKLIGQHLDFLKSLKKPALVISDFEKIFKTRESEILKVESSLWDFKMPEPYETWEWRLAPLGEVSQDYSLDLKVGTWKIHKLDPYRVDG